MPTTNIYLNPTVQNGKIFLFGFFVCCCIPFIAAKLALEFSWFSPGVGSRGQWLEREIQLLPEVENVSYPVLPQQASAIRRLHPSWRLVFVQAQHCGYECELALYTMQQLYLGLTGQQEKIGVVVVADKIPQRLNNFSAIAWQPTSANLTKLQNQIFIVNRRGIAILRYPAAQHPQQMLLLSKDIRTDLHRLLAFDRGGA